MAKGWIRGELIPEYLKLRSYKCLEEKVHKGISVMVNVKSEDEFLLRRGVDNGKHVIEITMPSKKVYHLGVYDTVKIQESEFKRYETILKKGGKLEMIYIVNDLGIPIEKVNVVG